MSFPKNLFGMPLRPLGDLKMVGFEIHQEAIAIVGRVPVRMPKLWRYVKMNQAQMEDSPLNMWGLCNMFSLEV